MKITATKAIERSLAAVVLVIAASACQSASPTATQPSAAPQATGATVAMYQYAGSKQCERGGKTLDVFQQELAAAGVQVQSASCGRDGRMYAQTCGMPDGRILVVNVPQSQAAAAGRLGLVPLRDLPGAVASACR